MSSTANPRFQGYSEGEIVGIEFGLLTNDEIVAESVVEITSDKLQVVTGEANTNTLYDPRMGPVGAGDICAYPLCLQGSDECHGHNGLIKLFLKVINPKLADYFLRILSCFCNCLIEVPVPGEDRTEMGLCMQPRFTKEDAYEKRNIPVANRIIEISQHAKVCTFGMVEIQGNIAKERHVQRKWLYETDKKEEAGRKAFELQLIDTKTKKATTVTPDQIWRWVRRIPTDALEQLGLKYLDPQSFIFENFPVIPTILRPPKKLDGGQFIHDGLTKVYADIVRCNNILKVAGQIDYGGEKYKNLCSAIFHLIDNKDEKARDGVNATGYKTLRAIFDGKYGLFRRLIMGSRGQQNGRTVIVGAPFLRVDQVAVPKDMADELSVTMTVTDHNRRLIQQLLLQNKLIALTSGRSRNYQKISLKRPKDMVLPPLTPQLAKLINIIKTYREEKGTTEVFPTIKELKALMLAKDEAKIKSLLSISKGSLYQQELKADIEKVNSTTISKQGDEDNKDKKKASKEGDEDKKKKKKDKANNKKKGKANKEGTTKKKEPKNDNIEEENEPILRRTKSQAALGSFNLDDEELASLIQKYYEYTNMERDILKFVNDRFKQIKRDDLIVRNLVDGDVVIVSRQPILHKESQMAFHAVIWNNKAIGLQPTVAQAFNADYDGDEMNLFVPQSIYSQADTLSPMFVSTCLMSEQSNKPPMGLIQDALLGCYLLTATMVYTIGKDKADPDYVEERGYIEQSIPREDWLQAAAQATEKVPIDIEEFEQRCYTNGVDPYSGPGLMSVAFPSNLNFRKKVNKTNTVWIENGVLKSGTMTKSVVGSDGNSIHQRIYLRNGPKAAADFLSVANAISSYWILSYGFTMGYKDMDVCKRGKITVKGYKPTQGLTKEEEEEERRRNDLLENTKLELVSELMSSEVNTANMNEFDRQRVEAEQKRTAQNMLDQISTIVLQYLDRQNAALLMVEAGSKGSKSTITQMAGMGGLIVLGGNKLIPKQLAGGTRHSTHYLEDDPDPTQKGLVLRSIIQGYSPMDMLNNAKATREALIAISQHTAETGYLQRRIVIFLINVSTFRDGSVRNGDGSIVQFHYAGDGLDRMRLTRIGGAPRFIDVEALVEEIKAEIRLETLKGTEHYIPLPKQAILNRFDIAKIIALRADQIDRGAPTIYANTIAQSTRIAKMEYEEGLINNIIIRKKTTSGIKEAVILNPTYDED